METLVKFGDRVETAPVRWAGAALAVHKPVTVDGDKPARGHWRITHHASGLSAGTFKGPLADAIKLARAWDATFHAALAPQAPEALTLKDWTHAQAWAAQLTRQAPPRGPVVCDPPRHAATFADGDGSEQLPVDVTLWPATNAAGEKVVRFRATIHTGAKRLTHPETGAPLRMPGDVAAFNRKGDPEAPPVLRLWWRGAWVDVPPMAQFGAWTFGEPCETPDGDPCDPDAPDSWLRLCGLV
jgi:hypothetical protein